MEIGAAEAKGGHPSAPGLVSGMDPGAAVGVEIEGAAGKIHEVGGLLDLERGRQHLVLQGECRLDQRGRPGSPLGVADLGLDAAQCTPLVVLIVGLAEHPAQGVDLCGITGLGAGAVGLQQFHGDRTHAGVLIGAFHGLHLAFGLGGIDGGTCAIGAGADAADHRIDGVAITLGIFQAAQRHHAETLAENGAIAIIGKWAAISGEAHGRRLGEAHVLADVHGGFRAPCDHHVGLVQVELVECHGQGGQRAGTGGIHGAVGAAQVETVGHPPGDDIVEQARKHGLRARRESLGNLIQAIGYFFLALPVFTHELGPQGTLQATIHGARKLEGACGAEDAADALAVDMGKTIP